MPGSKTHIIGYMAIGLTLVYACSTALGKTAIPANMPLLLALGCLYSVIPDIDHPNSLIRRVFSRQLITLNISSIIIYVFRPHPLLPVITAATGLTLYYLWRLSHRGAMHTINYGFILSIPLAVVSPPAALFGFTGYLSHIILDKTGV